MAEIIGVVLVVAAGFIVADEQNESAAYALFELVAASNIGFA